MVTNQRGVARGLVDAADLAEMHARLAATLAGAGAPLAGIYTCPHEIGQCECRKPGTGLFEQARRDNPWIAFAESHLVGDSISDVEAGHTLGLRLWVVGDDAASVMHEATERGFRIAGGSRSLAELAASGELLAAVSGT